MVSLVFIGCGSKSNEVNTIAMVTENDLASEIFIFFEQDTSIGNVCNKGDKYFFHINNETQIFFIKNKIGKGYIEFYKVKDKEYKEVFYSSPMTIKNAQNSSYHIVGGSLRTLYDTTNKKQVKYLTFKANYAAVLKDNWEIKEKDVLDKYYNFVNYNTLLDTNVVSPPPLPR